MTVAERTRLLAECRSELAGLEFQLAQREEARSRRGYRLGEGIKIEVLRSRLARVREHLAALEAGR